MKQETTRWVIWLEEIWGVRIEDTVYRWRVSEIPGKVTATYFMPLNASDWQKVRHSRVPLRQVFSHKAEAITELKARLAKNVSEAESDLNRAKAQLETMLKMDADGTL